MHNSLSLFDTRTHTDWCWKVYCLNMLIPLPFSKIKTGLKEVCYIIFSFVFLLPYSKLLLCLLLFFFLLLSLPSVISKFKCILANWFSPISLVFLLLPEREGGNKIKYHMMIWNILKSFSLYVWIIKIKSSLHFFIPDTRVARI